MVRGFQRLPCFVPLAAQREPPDGALTAYVAICPCPECFAEIWLPPLPAFATDDSYAWSAELEALLPSVELLSCERIDNGWGQTAARVHTWRIPTRS